MKILLVNADNGGIMHYAVDLANHLVQTQEVIIIAKKSAERLLNKNCEMIIVNDSRNLKLVFSQFKKTLLKYEPDIVHFTGYHPLFIILSSYLNKKRIPSIYTIHDAKRHPYKKNFVKNIRDRIIFNKFLNQHLINLSTNIVALSSYVAGQIKALYKADAVVIPLSQDVKRYNFIDYDIICKENNSNEESIKLLFFGSVSYYKGVDDLIKAAEILKQNDVKFKLTIAGKSDGYDLKIPDSVKSEISYLNRFIKEEETPCLFYNSDVVIQPYLEASQSGVLPLAFSFKKPVISTNLGSFTEIIEDGINGFTVNSKSPREIADLIVYLSKNKHLISELSEGAYKTYVDKLSWPQLIKKYIKLYEKATIRPL